MIKHAWVLLLALIAAEAKADSFSANLAQGKSEVRFEAVGKPSMLRIVGKAQGALKGALEFKAGKVSGTTVCELEKFETGISMRDDHMKHKYLETQKFPEATLTFANASYDPKSSENTPFEGELTLHGVKKAIKGKASFHSSDKDMEVQAEFALDLSDFNINQPSFSGITMAKAVTVSVTGKFPASVEASRKAASKK